MRTLRLQVQPHGQFLNLFSRGLLLLSSATALFFAPVSFAQLSSPPDVAKFVYQRVPTLALENQYIRTDSNKQAVESTLVSRIVQYHNSVKGRSPLHRIDWKTTLADYLGIHEVIQPETYPGYAFLKKNPLESDLASVQKLNAAQRNALVQSLVEAFTGNQAASGVVKTPAPVPQAKPEPTYRPVLTPLAVPGSAGSLKTKPIGRPSAPSGGEAQFLK
jgi:hypothetical protein